MARRNSILVNKALYQIGVITLISSLLWASMEIFNAASKKAVVDVDKSILEPINATIDQTVLDALTERLKVETETIAPSSTESASLSKTQSASDSAVIIEEEIE